MSPSLRSDSGPTDRGKAYGSCRVCGKPTALHPVSRSPCKTPPAPPPAFRTAPTGQATAKYGQVNKRSRKTPRALPPKLRQLPQQRLCEILLLRDPSPYQPELVETLIRTSTRFVGKATGIREVGLIGQTPGSS